MSAADWVVLALVLAAAALALRGALRRRKRGGCCGCAGCADCAACRAKRS